MDREALLRRLKEIEVILEKVKVPGFDVDVVSSGVVQKLRISADGKRLAVYVDFTGSDPSCGFCKFINHTLWSAIAREIRNALINVGFTEVLIIDSSSGAPLDYIDEHRIWLKLHGSK